MLRVVAAAVLAITIALPNTRDLCAADEALAVGDKAPLFSALDDTGKPWKSADVVGKKVLVVYFYPADLTGGCTKQACGFRDDLEKLTEQGVVVVGVSGDSVRNHQLFKKVHTLNFPLLADTDRKVADAFGVPTRAGGTITRVIDGEEQELTRAYSAARWTFVIGLDGTIKHRNTKVDAAKDSAAVLELLGESN